MGQNFDDNDNNDGDDKTEIQIEGKRITENNKNIVPVFGNICSWKTHSTSSSILYNVFTFKWSVGVQQIVRISSIYLIFLNLSWRELERERGKLTNHIWVKTLIILTCFEVCFLNLLCFI